MGITTNLALNKPALSSSYVLPYAASNAVNASLAPVSRWLCNTLPGWMCVDLGATYWINRWVVRHMSTAGWQSPSYNMSDFKLQGSNDNRTWYDLDSVVGNTAGITDRTMATAVNVRYVRVYVTKGINCNPKLASIMEFEVYPAPSSQYLTGITLSTGTLSPQPFAGRSTFAYTASVGYDVTNITLTPIAEDANAIIRVNNVVVKSNTASGAIPLNVGANAISVQVTGSDGSSQATYTVTVTRAFNPYLTALTISSGSLSPGFSPTNPSYNVTVTDDILSVTVTPSVETPSASTITVNGATVASGQPSQPINVGIGNTNIAIQVTTGSVVQNYTITVARASSPYLTGLVLSNALGATVLPFTQGFSMTNLSYTAKVLASVTNVKVTPTAEGGTSISIKVGANTVVSGNTSPNILVTAKPATITVTVTSAGGVVKQYTINVTL